MKLYYENSEGTTLDLSGFPYLLTFTDAYDYTWEVESAVLGNNKSKVQKFKRNSKQLSASIAISSRYRTDFTRYMDDFFSTVEVDVVANKPGKLITENGEYMQCYIVESENNRINPLMRLNERNVTIMSPYPFWITEAKKQFAPVGREEIEGEFLDYTLTPRLMFNQLVQNGNFVDVSGWGGSLTRFDFSASNNIGKISMPTAYTGDVFLRKEVDVITGHKFYQKAEVKVVGSGTFASSITSANGRSWVNFTPTGDWQTLETISNAVIASPARIDFVLRTGATGTYEIRNVVMVDLTQMFGAGNEPTTVAEFKAMFPNDYYEYTTGKPVYIADKNSPNLDYNYDYSYETPGIRTWNLDHYATSEFKLTIYGYCENPRILVNGYPYQIFGTVEENEFLVIDSREKTVTHYLNNGTTENWFDFRNKENSVFEPLPSGNLTLTWDGTYGFDILAYLERSEPRWT